MRHLKRILTPYIHHKGGFIGYKTLHSHRRDVLAVATLWIPADADVIRGDCHSVKMRASRVKVLSIHRAQWTGYEFVMGAKLKQCKSRPLNASGHTTVYRVGKETKPHYDFNTNEYASCVSGIHFCHSMKALAKFARGMF